MEMKLHYFNEQLYNIVKGRKSSMSCNLNKKRYSGNYSSPLKSEKGPRQKIYLYVSLILCTGVFIYFYSYPLTQKWNFISPENNKDRAISSTDQKNSYYSKEENIKLADAKLRETTAVSPAHLLTSSHRPITVPHKGNYSEYFITRVEQLNSTQETNSLPISIQLISSNPAVYSEAPLQRISVINSSSTVSSTAKYDLNTSRINGSSIKEEVSSSASKESLLVDEEAPVQKGFLVFSEKCRIPDLDPMHPSIRHLVDYTPPLNCSEDYEPLTKTEGNLLILDVKAIEKFVKDNYSCCYQTVFRENDGSTDNDVGCVFSNSFTFYYVTFNIIVTYYT
ncbi:uncharacterized protein LOC118191609 [Stegodyphus dumicola]|uniref:uncharacterized protein LOC118191609 n=1 Tax=Stegodyphus dumicola TaxID=202533 RepID=UPI0015A8738E|nr:uncharacterized protein LOC118191609 [Stegodyphus dumicola]